MENLNNNTINTTNPGPSEPNPPQSKSFLDKYFLAISILVAALLISGSILISNSRDGSPSEGAKIQAGSGERVNVSADDDPFLGNPKAKVRIIEFSDFQCPFCRKFWEESFAEIKKDYIDTGKVMMVFRDFPLDFHPAATPSAQGGGCAQEQGKFWEYHDKLFIEQGKKGSGTITYTSVEIKKWAAEIGLNGADFDKCLESGKYKSEVEKDAVDGAAAGVTGTPTTFINGIKVVGAQPYSVFKQVIDAELKK